MKPHLCNHMLFWLGSPKTESIPNRSQANPKPTQYRFQTDPKLIPKRPRTDPRPDQPAKPNPDGVQADPKPIPNQIQTDTKPNPNRTQTNPKPRIGNDSLFWYPKLLIGAYSLQLNSTHVIGTCSLLICYAPSRILVAIRFSFCACLNVVTRNECRTKVPYSSIHKVS